MAFIGVLLLLKSYGMMSGFSFSDRVTIISLAAGVVGTAYIMTVKNPCNYFGMAFGVVSSILLTIQFYWMGFPDLPVLYVCVFIPCQVVTVFVWYRGNKRLNNTTENAVLPKFLGRSAFFLVTLSFFVMTFLDFGISGIINNNAEGASFAEMVRLGFQVPTDTKLFAIQLISAVMVASSILSNTLMIKKKSDTWYYWVIYSAAGMVLNLLVQNYFSFMLFILFLIINLNGCIAWFKITPKENMGWLKR